MELQLSTMWLPVVFAALAILLLSKFLRRSRGDLRLIPGPSMTSLVWSVISGEARKIDYAKIHQHIAGLAKAYGPIMTIPELDGKRTVVVSDYDLIYQVFVTSGKEVGGRLNFFSAQEILGCTGIQMNLEPDAKWKALRKLTHAHMRQFGEGMTDLQRLLTEVGEGMFDEITRKKNVPCDPKDIIEMTALRSIMFIISGHIPVADDPIVQMMKRIDVLSREILSVSPSLSFKILNAFPWTRYIPYNYAWSQIQKLLSWQDDLIMLLEDVYKSDPAVESLYRMFKEKLEDGSQIISEWDVKKTIFGLMLAGVVTSSGTLYALINLLAHHPEIQEKMFEEIQRVIPDSEDITVLYRHKLHYCKAVLLETLRYFTTTPLSIPHRTCCDTKIGKYLIPNDTVVLPLTWSLHHDPEFWSDPNVFKPERFLDENGEAFPIDHPRRKRLLPFGAGPRVCVAETLATVRLFLWSTMMVRRFKIRPAPGNSKSLTQADSYLFNGILASEQYQVVFSARDI